MKIAKVTCWILRMPWTAPLIEEVQHQWGCFVEIETEDGLKGHALSTSPMRHGVREYINREAGPAMIGMDPLRTEDIRNKLFWATAKYFMGAWSHATSLIDIALWDLKGKALGAPIWKLLGGAQKEIPAYITFGFPFFDDDQLVELAKKLVADGQTRLKMTVGSTLVGVHGSWVAPTDQRVRRDAERVRKVREGIGPDVELMIDGNKGFNYPQGLMLAKLCEEYNITWFEDPFIQGDPRLLAKLRNQTTIPLAAGSTGTGDLMYLREFLLLDAVDYLQPNVRDIGGYTQGIKAAGLAKAFNVQLSMGGNYPHLNMHLLGGVTTNGRLEFHLQGWACVTSLFDGAEHPAPGGTMTLPEAPGLGFTPKDGILDLAVEA